MNELHAREVHDALTDRRLLANEYATHASWAASSPQLTALMLSYGIPYLHTALQPVADIGVSPAAKERSPCICESAPADCGHPLIGAPAAGRDINSERAVRVMDRR